MLHYKAFLRWLMPLNLLVSMLHVTFCMYALTSLVSRGHKDWGSHREGAGGTFGH